MSTTIIPIDILLVGSSIVKKWTTLSKHFTNSTKLVNLGISSYTTQDMLMPHYINMLSIYKPKNLIYYCGNNDIRENIDQEIVIQNIKNFVNIVKKMYGVNTNIIIISLFQNPKKSIYNKSIDIVNSNILKYSKRVNISFLDVTEELYDTKYFMKDNIHLLKIGYQKINEKILDILQN